MATKTLAYLETLAASRRSARARRKDSRQAGQRPGSDTEIPGPLRRLAAASFCSSLEENEEKKYLQKSGQSAWLQGVVHDRPSQRTFGTRTGS